MENLLLLVDKIELGIIDVYFFYMVNLFKILQVNKFFICLFDYFCLIVLSNDYVIRKEFCIDVFKLELVYVLYNLIIELKLLILNINFGRVEFLSLLLRYLNYFQLNELVDVVVNSEKSRIILKDFIIRNVDQILFIILRFEIIGDNLDYIILLINMIKDKQRKSFYWFLNVVV